MFHKWMQDRIRRIALQFVHIEKQPIHKRFINFSVMIINNPEWTFSRD